VTRRKPAPGDLLRAIYFHCDRAAVLAEFPGLTEAELRDVVDGLIAAHPGDAAGHAPSEAGPAAPAHAADSVVLYTDGGSRGNPGPAGCGVVMTDEAGAVLGERAEFLGRATNNAAEYRGLLAGLRLAREAGAKRVCVRSDSELLVRQINGAYKVKSATLRPLFEEARRLLASFEAWRVEHVRRHLNARADALANSAMDRAKGRNGGSPRRGTG
jgi:ribonuclease HI